MPTALRWTGESMASCEEGRLIRPTRHVGQSE